MNKFDSLTGVVVSTPIIENESPFYLSFNIRINNDTVPCTFVGNFARALKNNIRVGDMVMPREGIIDNGRLVFSFMHLTPNSAKGRNIDTYVI